MQQDHSGLWAVSPIDGRYSNKIGELKNYCSEAALILYRTRVECEWLVHLSDIPQLQPFLKLSGAQRKELLAWTSTRAASLPGAVKAIEAVTNHDVKAVEYYLQQEMKRLGYADSVLAFVHFACTSEDINNLSYALMCRDLREKLFLPTMDSIIRDLSKKAEAYGELGMLSRTHGQPASPTTLGREFAVFGHRLLRIRDRFAAQSIEGKMNGAVGNYNAHVSAFPEVDWDQVAKEFIEKKLVLAQNKMTTQIENHDSLVEYTTTISQFNTVLIGLCRDVWSYISIGYFKQTVKAGEVGSSTMPHKVNPIDFENAEGNLGIACAMASHFSDKLPISRWQRDLSDSTVLRTLGTYAGHCILAWNSLLNGLGKVTATESMIEADLQEAWEVLAEPFQTVMRKYGMVDAYDRLKAATRGKPVTREILHALIDSCAAVPKPEVVKLKLLRPETYLGIAVGLAKDFVVISNRRLGKK